MKRRKLIRQIDRAAERLDGLTAPEEGWISGLRQALGLSADQIARRKGVSRNAVYQAERSEKDGAISLKQMERFANAMGGRFVYAIVLDEPVEARRYRQAKRKAARLSRTAPEAATLGPEDMQDWIEDKAAELLHIMPADFWDETGAGTQDGPAQSEPTQ